MPLLNLASSHHEDWFNPKKSHRSFGAIGAICVTCFFFLQFQIGLKNQIHKNTNTTDFMDLTWIPVFTPQALPETPSQKQKIPEKVNNKIVREVQEKTISFSITNVPSISSPTKTQTETDNKTEITTIEQSSESKPAAESTLKFDSKSIRRAYQDSKTDIQKMAEASGKPLIKTPYTSKYDEFQNAASRAAKKDCLSANSGGSLLSLITIPVMAAMDKCKLP